MSTVQVVAGSCIRFNMAWADESGPMDLTGLTAAVVDSKPAILQQAEVTVTDAAGGIVEVHIPSTLSSSLELGKSNWVQVGITLLDGCQKITPPVWIEAS